MNLFDAASLASFSPARLSHPWVFVGLVAFAVFVIAFWLRSPRTAWAHPAWSELVEAGARAANPRRRVRGALRLCALALLAWALAEPLALRPSPPEIGRGLDIMLALDTSGSMRALDAAGGAALPGATSAAAVSDPNKSRTRLDLAIEAVRRFADERVSEGDRVGLVIFGDHAFTQCPLTSDGAVLDAALEGVRAEMAGRRTALGDALALAIRRLGAAARPADGGSVVVLLTDGRSTTGDVPPQIATDLAVAHGVRVHTVGIGSDLEQVAVADGPDGRVRLERHVPDFAVLSRLALETGGRFHRARHSMDLTSVYQTIDALERVDRPEPRPPQTRSRPEPALALALVLVLGEISVGRLGLRDGP